MKSFVAGILVAVLVACGGGGGSAGTTSSGSGAGTGTGTITSSTPTITMGLSGGGNAIVASGSTLAQATVLDGSGAPLVGKLVTFTGDPLLIKFSPSSGQVLTVAGGIASIQVSPASVTSAGAGSMTATTIANAKTLSSQFDFQLSPANLGLQTLDLGAGSLAAFANRGVSVLATVNGVSATNIPVQVTFTASCGSVSPTVVTTDGTGTASTTYTANLAVCAGTNVTISASTVGATTVSGLIPVASPIATNVQFISTTPQLIYLAGTVGSTQAQTVFKVVDSIGTPLQNKKVRLSLSNTATGVSLNTVSNTSPVDLTTDSLGQVSLAVFSGTVPTSLNVRATLLDSAGAPTSVFSDSNLLTVASGKPVQSSLSLAVEKKSIEGYFEDGQTTNLTLSMADRQGNPVPPGTQVNFVSETGVVQPAVCFVPPVIPATATSPAIPVSACTVTFRSQGTRTQSGRVSILAYTPGEENFVDGNGNNVYDLGEAFTDLGRAYRDDYAQSSTVNGVYDSGEFQVPRLGTNPCTAAAGCVGDGVWGAADVRNQATVVFSSSKAVITSSSLVAATNITGSSPATNGLSTVYVTVADAKGNSMPTGSTIAISAIDDGNQVPGFAAGTNCRVSSPASYTIPNSLEPMTVEVSLAFCTKGDQFIVTVTTPTIKTVTPVTFTVQ